MFINEDVQQQHWVKVNLSVGLANGEERTALLDPGYALDEEHRWDADFAPGDVDVFGLAPNWLNLLRFARTCFPESKVVSARWCLRDARTSDEIEIRSSSWGDERHEIVEVSEREKGRVRYREVIVSLGDRAGQVSETLRFEDTGTWVTRMHTLNDDARTRLPID